jgi:FAD/FMN-containing dehydrogenase
LESELVTNGVLAQDTTQLQALWAIRETIGESAGKAGSVYKYDVSVPVGQMYDVVEKVRTRLGEAGLLGKDWEGRLGVYEGGRILAAMGYGHMGDGETLTLFSVKSADTSGNLHINVVADKYDDEIEKVLEPYIYEIVCKSASYTLQTVLTKSRTLWFHLCGAWSW